MKFSIKAFGLVGLVLILVGGGLLYRSWGNEVKKIDTTNVAINIEAVKLRGLNAKIDALNQQISDAQVLLDKTQAELVPLQDELIQADARLAAAMTLFPLSAGSIEYTDIFLQLAAKAGIKLQNITTSDIGIADLSTKTDLFYGTGFSLDINGDIDQIIAFVDLITSSDDFRSGRIGNIDVEIPVPVPPLVVTQAEKDAIYDASYNRIWQEEFDRIKTEMTPYARVVYTGDAVLELLGAGNDRVTLEVMTDLIRQTIGSVFGANIANQYSSELAEAIETQVADSLISIVAQIYANAIGALFEAGEPDLTPEYGGILGPDITEQLLGIPPPMVAGLVNEMITERLNEIVDGYIADMIYTQDVEQRATIETAAAVDDILANQLVTPPTLASLTLTVFTYGGE